MEVPTTSALPPLTLESVAEIASLLSQSLSPDAQQQKQSERALKAIECRENFASCLLELLIRRDHAERSARWLASVYLKNIVLRSWRTRLQGCISSEEKDRVRRGLLELVDEPDAQVGVQIALAISKVARFDFPKEWPDVVERLVGMIGQVRADLKISPISQVDGSRCWETVPSERVLQRAYMVLNLVLKELSSKRLAADQKTFEGLCSGLYEILVGWWMEDCANLRPEMLDRLLLEMKCIKRVVIQGIPSDAKTLQLAERVQALCPFLVTTLRSWLEISGDAFVAVADPTQAVQSLSMLKPSIKLLKMTHAVQETHCWAFAASGSLIPYLELLCGEVARECGVTIGTDGNNKLTAVELLEKHRRILAALYAAVKCPGYRGSTSMLLMPAGKARELKQHLERMAAEVGASLKQFWAMGERDSALLILLVRRYFPLTEEELSLWDRNGEEFHQETEHAAKDETVRGCAELLYNTLLESNREALGPVVINLMRHCSLEDLADPRVALDTAAVMHAVSLGAYDLYDLVNFQEVLMGTIVPVVSHMSLHGSNQELPLHIRQVKREALRLVAYWVPKLKPHDKPTVYSLLLSVLPERDSAMFLMACSALQAVMEDWDFDVEQFRPFATDAVRLLIDDLARCLDYESQLEVFSLLNLVIDHLQERSKECTPMILHMIPQLWRDSEGQGLLRIQILLALQRLVHALGVDSPMTYPVVLPILQLVIDADIHDPVNALEDGVCLWIVVLRHAPGPADGLVTPLGGLLRFMRNSTEHIFTGTRCITSAVLLYGDALLDLHGFDVNSVLRGYVGNVKDKALTDVIHCLDIVVQACPRQGLRYLADTIVAILLDIFNPERSNQVIAPFLALIISRLTIRSPEELIRLLEYACTSRSPDVNNLIVMYEAANLQGLDVSNGMDGLRMASTPHRSPLVDASALPRDRLFACLLDLWLEKFDSIAPKGMRKLAALGLSAVVKLDVPCVALRFDEMITHIASVWAEVEQGPDVDTMALSYPIAGAGPRDDFIPVSVDLDEAEGEAARRQSIFAESPIAALPIKEHFQQCMRQVVDNHKFIQQAAERLSGATRKMFDDLMTRDYSGS